MTVSPAQTQGHDDEARFLDALRERYEANGFTFLPAPARIELPSFFGSYLPDAVARKGGQNIAIEVKRRQSQSTDRALQEIRRLFEGQPDWQFSVVFMGAEPTTSTPPSEPSTILRRLGEVRALNAEGHHREAFVMAWSLLEATLKSLNSETASQPRTAGTVVQTLTMNGYIAPELERRMRPLVELRNRIVHGDLVAEPTSNDVEVVLSATEQSLSANAA